MSTPAVSIIIPVYNVEQWLPACLDSALAQTLANIEVICVDDCSTDGCAAILAEYAARDPRIRVLATTENVGQGVARNVGLAQASGRYVYFLDSDDMVAPEALEELVARADADELDGIFFDSDVVYDSEKLAKRYASYPSCHTGQYPEGVITGRELFELFVAQQDWTCYVQRQLWRRAYLIEKGIEFPALPSHEDEEFALEAITQALRIAFVPKPYFIRRYREGSTMTSKAGVRSFTSYFQCWCLMTWFAGEHGLSGTAYDRNAARIYAGVVREHERLLKEGVDLTEPLEKVGLLKEYQLFASSQKGHLHYGMVSPKTITQLKSAKRVFIYGAGVLASNCFFNLMFEDMAVEGFIVTSMEGNPPVLRGHHVYPIADVPLDREAVVLIAVTDGYRPDVEAVLDAAGWRHVYCKDGWDE